MVALFGHPAAPERAGARRQGDDRRRSTGRRAVDDQHRHGRCDGTAIQVELARAGSEIVRITVNTPEAAAPCPTSASSSTAWASTCRSSATSTTTATGCSTRLSGLRRRRCRSTASIPATWARATSATASSRQMIEAAMRLRQAGAHRRQLGQPRPGAAGPADGRERPPRRAVGRRVGDVRGAGHARPSNRAGAPRSGPGPRPDHPVVQGERRAGPDRGLPRARRRAATMRCTWA